MLLDALSELNGWNSDDGRLSRTLPLDESQHAELAEQIKIFADTLNVQPDVTRSEDATEIVLSRNGGVSLTDVTFAGRVESAYLAIAGELAAQEDSDFSGNRFTRWLKRSQLPDRHRTRAPPPGTAPTGALTPPHGSAADSTTAPR